MRLFVTRRSGSCAIRENIEENQHPLIHLQKKLIFIDVFKDVSKELKLVNAFTTQTVTIKDLAHRAHIATCRSQTRGGVKIKR